MKFINDWKIVGILCLTIGLAPFMPEPHIWGKVKWLAGGGTGMQLADYWDTLMHGFPFILLLRIIVLRLLPKKKEK